MNSAQVAIPADEDIVRHVKGTLMDGARPTGAAFQLKAGEVGLSFNRIGSDPDAHASAIAIARGHSRLVLKNTARFVQLNVGEAIAAIDAEPELGPIGAWEAKLPAEDEFAEDPTHAEIRDLPPVDDDRSLLAGVALASLVKSEHVHPAVAKP